MLSVAFEGLDSLNVENNFWRPEGQSHPHDVILRSVSTIGFPLGLNFESAV